VLLCAGLCAGLAAPAAAAEPRQAQEAGRTFSAEIDAFLLSGEYGAAESTDILYLPLILRAAGPRHTFSFTLPYLRVEGPATVVAGEAGGVPTGDEFAGASEARSGVGDILLRGEVFLVQGDGVKKPWVSALGRLKFPTASREKGLGTGEYDVSAGVSVTQPMGRRAAGFVDLIQRRTGDPPGEPLRDTTAAVAGVSVLLARRVTVYLSYDWEEALVSDLEDGESLSAGFVARPGRDWRWSGAAFFGLSDTREDFGAMLGVARTWAGS
jgi:hypothetical protein